MPLDSRVPVSLETLHSGEKHEKEEVGKLRTKGLKKDKKKKKESKSLRENRECCYIDIVCTAVYYSDGNSWTEH